MNFTIQKREKYSLVKVAGVRLDSFVAPELKAEFLMLVNQGEHEIILDLSGCEFCDSSGLSAILVGNRLCDDSEGTFILCHLSESVDRMIRLAMLDSILLMAADVEEAEKLLQKKTEL